MRTLQLRSAGTRLPKQLTVEPLPGKPGTYAFMDGPVALAGLDPGGERFGLPLYPVEKTFRL